VATDVAEDGDGPVDPERAGQRVHEDALAVGGGQLGHLVGSETVLDRNGGLERVDRVDGGASSGFCRTTVPSGGTQTTKSSSGANA
jgi:hypothetical protein